MSTTDELLCLLDEMNEQGHIGYEDYSQLHDAIAATLGSGKLTAEQVRGVLLTHLPHREYYSVEQTDAWQAIADELNAVTGGGTCEFAEGGTVSRNYINSGEEGSICPIPRASVIFEGQKLTFDSEDSEKLVKLVEGHFRKLAGLGDAR